uniref:Uncharacterized protein n=1 Tax=Triticum urartu TaxID=4572 RepID=A0A8R7K4R4_TRIUA
MGGSADLGYGGRAVLGGGGRAVGRQCKSGRREGIKAAEAMPLGNATGGDRSWPVLAPGDARAMSGGRRRGGGVCLRQFSDDEVLFANLPMNWEYNINFGTEGVY